jgi:hypothetical protein
LALTNLLFLCARNHLRSPTAERVFAGRPGVETASASLVPIPVFVILRQAAQRRRPGDPAARASANLSGAPAVHDSLPEQIAFGAAGSSGLAALAEG